MAIASTSLFFEKDIYPFVGFTNIVHSMVNEETRHNVGILCVLTRSFFRLHFRNAHHFHSMFQ